MKVIKDKVPGSIFSDIQEGNAFGFSGNVYIKCRKEQFINYNCVRLNDGSYGNFKPETPVTSYPNARIYINVEVSE